MANLGFSIPVCASDDIEHAGDIIQIIIPVTAGGMALYKDDQKGLMQFSKSFLTTLSVTYALKYSYIFTGYPDYSALIQSRSGCCSLKLDSTASTMT